MFSTEFCEILEQLLWRIIFGGLLLKRKQEEKGAQGPLWFQVLTFSKAVIYKVMIKSCIKPPFSTNFCIAEPSNLDYVIHFYKPKKGLSGPVFTIKILVAKIFDGDYAGN